MCRELQRIQGEFKDKIEKMLQLNGYSTFGLRILPTGVRVCCDVI
jgi:hypothetical protein